MNKKFKDYINEDKDLVDEFIYTPTDIINDLFYGDICSATKQTIATPIRITKNIFDDICNFWDW